MKNALYQVAIVVALCLLAHSAHGQSDVSSRLDSLEQFNRNLGHRLDRLEKMVDDLMWFQRLGDVAVVDKVYMTGPPLWKEKNPDGQGAGNPVKFWAYVFVPRGIDASKKYPLIVLPHGGVHSDFSTYYTHIVRELVAQQYVVVAAEYRGSTGYGASHYRKIDYGGLEVEDVDASRAYMIENYDFVDGQRVGIIGWSHGGLIALHNLFDHPDHYKVGFAGVPVSDLIARMGYKDQDYRDLYEAEFHIGQSAEENVEEYKRRSPAWRAHLLQTPLLIHTNTNDADVNVLEVEHLIKSLKAEEKQFEYEIFHDLPGGHSFDRMDTKTAKQVRVKIWMFLAGHLQPPRPISSVADIDTAAYR